MYAKPVFAFFVTLFAGILLTVAAGLTYVRSYEAGVRDLRAEAATDMAVFSATLLAPKEKYSYLAEVVATYPAVSDVLREPDNPRRVAEANALLYRLNASAGADTIYILNEAGRVVAASNYRQPDSFVGQNYAFRPYYQEAMRGKSSRFYGIGTTSQLPGYYLSHPVCTSDRVAGVAVVKVDLSRLDQEWKGNDKHIAVLDENGVVFLSSKADWKYHPVEPLTAQTLDDMRRTRQYGATPLAPIPATLVKTLSAKEHIIRIGTPPGADGVTESLTYLVHSNALPASSWTVNVFLPLNRADAAAQRAAGIAACMAALVVLSLLFLRQRMQSRQALELAHQALARQHENLQKLGDELRISAITDPLTGAYNRRHFLQSIEEQLAHAGRRDLSLAILLIDFDHFKDINDRHGHLAGDSMLQTLTQLCKSTLREGDVFARFGGEEFIMSLPNTDAASAAIVAERLRERIASQRIELDGAALRLTVTIGVAMHRTGKEAISDTIMRADKALYRGKQSGRNQVCVDSP